MAYKVIAELPLCINVCCNETPTLSRWIVQKTVGIHILISTGGRLGTEGGRLPSAQRGSSALPVLVDYRDS
jgi:hypothetical protein